MSDSETYGSNEEDMPNLLSREEADKMVGGTLKSLRMETIRMGLQTWRQMTKGVTMKQAMKTL
jgi:hypothetical protein